jgi:putative FmdB family regulatory protein
MPIYEYSCRDCGAEFEKLIGAQAAVACPSCQGGRVIRRISLVTVKAASHRSGSAMTTAGACCGGGGCGCH